ncbi:hypothetical protein [Deinococcus ruber]|nr:hypothetical protein [Deinococcus ruber]
MLAKDVLGTENIYKLADCDDRVSSWQVIREALMKRFLNACSDRRISGLPADREFIGKLDLLL